MILMISPVPAPIKSSKFKFKCKALLASDRIKSMAVEQILSETLWRRKAETIFGVAFSNRHPKMKHKSYIQVKETKKTLEMGK
jgi:hypothetical protein